MKMVFLLFISSLIFLTGQRLSAVTPQVYCASLGSSSCELLSMTPSSPGSYILNYCRNGKFRITHATSNGVQGFYVYNADGASSRVNGYLDSSIFCSTVVPAISL